MKRWIIAAWLFTLVCVAYGVVGKERLIASGDVVYLRLAPVDPRSMMQGDYMALDFALAGDVARDRGYDASREQLVVIRVDDKKEGHFARLYTDQPLAANERLLRVQNVRSGNGVQISTNAWFFQEGQGERFQAARFGEFRVGAGGEALLVGMRDEKLNPL